MRSELWEVNCELTIQFVVQNSFVNSLFTIFYSLFTDLSIHYSLSSYILCSEGLAVELAEGFGVLLFEGCEAAGAVEVVPALAGELAVAAVLT